MDDERDAEDAIRRLDRTVFGRKGRQLRVEWTKVSLGMICSALEATETLHIVYNNYCISRHAQAQDSEQDFLLIFHF